MEHSVVSLVSGCGFVIQIVTCRVFKKDTAACLH